MSLPTTVVDYIRHDDNQPSHRSSAIDLGKSLQTTFVQEVTRSEPSIGRVEASASDEFKLPSRRSLFVVIFGNALFQVTFFIIVSSASAYAEHLGGTATFSGLTIGIPTVFSGLALLVTTRLDKGRYNGCFQFAYLCAILGNITYGLAYRANFLYLILIGRCITGFSFICFMYHKRYCADPRIVGIRRRTTLASWLVLGQAFGFSAGPFLGGVLHKIGFGNRVFNGYTSPGWIMAGAWCLFWPLSNWLFEDAPPRPAPSRSTTPPPTSTPIPTTGIELPTLSQPTSRSPTPPPPPPSWRDLSWRQWGVTACMCWFAMTCFNILGAWESNIPVYSAIALGYSPFQAGNFIALGGICTLPFLLLNVRYARKFQDRTTLATGTSLGLAGLLIMLILIKTDKVSFGPFFVCWFLVALGFNLASTCTLSLLSKQLPDEWVTGVSMAIQYSNYTGRVTGAVLGGAGVKIGMPNYLGIQIAIVGFGGVMYLVLWRDLKAKTG
ncbi:membrane transporter [Coprinopsis cinerea okayama7|uniref:Membrane transporter n=1 Tax=Coprinopsis cinerea (strain Okayama-7 / 130 / ATCC MYA-4618 / FGSC 9003) TaxID=240176 RepID=A8N0X6_COPC7|nr:membrane transporter [Coprinopsis cinerea okayama7\|eukprot:XP_001828525.1 membrane transporter [Coprinopsis cinerea okayama7\